MERAEKTVDEKVQSKGQHQTQSLDRQLAAAGITVIRAPKGMSRQRENKTHRSKSGCVSASVQRADTNYHSNKNVIWTVEWIDADKNRTITQTSSAEQIFRASPLYESPAQKRKRGAEKAAQKAAEKPDAEQQAEKQGTEKPQETTEKPQEATEKPQEATEKPQSDPSPNAPSDPTSVDTPTKPAYTPTHIFYLHRPRTSSAHPVLIPLDSATSLSEALTRRTVLEYPTIYMFAADAPLPEGYMLESAYLKQEGEEAAELEEMLGSVAPGVLKEEEGKEEVLDSQRLLDVLKADLGGAV